MSKKRNTLVVNLYGGPGAGKSTFMANLFYKLKVLGIEVEMAPEFAKDLVWEERFNYFDEQIYIFAKQLHRINRVLGKVDVCISDSPLQNSYIYLKEENPELKALIDKEFAHFNNLNFYIKRGNKYVQNGRNEDEEQAKEVDRKIETLLSTLPHQVVDRSIDTDYLVEQIVEKVNQLNPPVIIEEYLSEHSDEEFHTLQEIYDMGIREGDIVAVNGCMKEYVLLRDGIPDEYNTALCCTINKYKTLHLCQIGFHWCGDITQRFCKATPEEIAAFKTACIETLKKPIHHNIIKYKVKDKETGEEIEKEYDDVFGWDEDCYAQILGALVKYNLMSQSSAYEFSKKLESIHKVDLMKLYTKKFKR